jgi:hypothetical protein
MFDIFFIRHCKRLTELGFLDKEPNENNHQKLYAYRISSKGVHFIDALSMENREAPYTYYVKIEKEALERIREREDLDDKVKAITINSITTPKWMSYGSLFIAGLSIMATLLISTGTTHTDTTIRSMPQLMQNQEQIRKRYEIKTGDVIENFTKPNELVFSTGFIQSKLPTIPIKEILYLLNLCKISGEILRLTTEDGIIYWAYSSSFRS